MNALTTYLEDIARVPLLSADEARTLGLVVQRGMEAAREVHRRDEAGADPDELEEFRSAIREGLEAKQRMVAANLRLVVAIAKRYRGIGGAGVEFLDLIQEGTFGLMRAVEKWDPSRGFTFATYASDWIRNRMTRALDDQVSTVRLPVHLRNRLDQIRATEAHLREQIGREPTSAEVADELGIPERRVEKYLRALSISETVSLDAPLATDDGEGGALADFVEDPGALEGMEAVEEDDRLDLLDTALARLPPRERTVVRSRFGFEGGEPHTLEEVGQELGVTRERVRQIEGKAVARLVHPAMHGA